MRRAGVKSNNLSVIMAALIIVRAYRRDEYTLNNIAIVTARVSSAKVVSIRRGA